MKSNRPLSVAIIGWILIVVSIMVPVVMSIVISSLGIWNRLRNDPTAPSGYVYIAIGLGLAFTLICGFYILKGKNWARWAYIIFAAAGQMVSLVSNKEVKFIPIVALVIFTFFLFTKRASDFFHSDKAFRPLD